MGSFCPKYVNARAKKQLCVTTLKKDAKFEAGLTCCLKNDTRKLMNFDLSI